MTQQALARIATAALGAATLLAATLPAHAQWAIDYTVRYDASGQQTGKPGERRGPDTLVSEKTTWRVQQEVRGTLNYTQKVRGAVASNMPDKNNEQRYDSWISRSGRAGNPAWMKLDAEEVIDSAARLAKADGEGAGDLNRERAGKFGRVEHLRTRIAMAAEGPGAAKLNDPFVQIDRVDGKLHFEPPAVDLDPAQVRYAVQKVTRMDKPAAAGEWDSSDAKDGAQRTMALRLPLLPVQVFDMPRDAQSFEATRTVDVPGRIGGKATITVALRRAGAAPPAKASNTATPAATGGAVAATGAAAATAVVAAPAPAQAARPAAADPCAPKDAASVTTAADAGAVVGGAALGGGHGRNVGAAVGGFLGALGGKKDKSGSVDCPPPAR
ncbi:hypothetical protein HZ992_16980 [Rhizobacter sp. AJA081-3]|uniref:hypothetical protein n=1 Tax=Rhizobacter sp. AJA081-3 TaxID=2753607 RepID=UPI001AE04BA0|nr:hypothetical protein [Rhizobacter sp. AJA081-3]QTN21855.1 hypothetical protein HZ992_16980 [Rhizobacter sp. AJA081-3]